MTSDVAFYLRLLARDQHDERSGDRLISQLMALRLMLSTFLPSQEERSAAGRTKFRRSHYLQNRLFAVLLQYVKHQTGSWHALELGTLVGVLLDRSDLDLESWRKRNPDFMTEARRHIPEWKAVELRRDRPSRAHLPHHGFVWRLHR